MSPSTAGNKPYSLQKRLVLAFGVLLILFLGLAGVVLDRAYKQSVAAAVQERLQLQIYALLGVAEPEGDGFFLPELEEARFSQIDSGLYGLIVDGVGHEVWRSPSALNLELDDSLFLSPTPEAGRTLFGSLDAGEQGELVWASYGTNWENHDSIYSFVVLESSAPSAAQIREFQSNLYLWFGALAVFLSVAQYLLLRWGLRPLQKLAGEVSAIEAGELDQLHGDYPSELQPVTDNLNLLIKSERERQARYRTTLGDLAHSLKTPLAVLSTALQDSGDGEGVSPELVGQLQEQVARMDEIVTYQLHRAVKSNQPRVLARPVPVAPLLQRLLQALGKVYRDKDMQVTTDLQDELLFYGEESDLMELCGNLLDNAFKYGRSRVSVRAGQVAHTLRLEFGDDGDGIAEQDRDWVLQRGARADTVKSGQGIGLAVVVEIVSAYGGEIRVTRNDWGGASLVVLFPEHRHEQARSSRGAAE